jgi:hypothetical protein
VPRFFIAALLLPILTASEVQDLVDRSAFREMALALPETTEAPHFDRTAFKVHRIFATLDGEGRTANFKFTPDEQEFKCQLAPDVFAPLDNAWGKQGWTAASLSAASADEIRAALEMAHAHAVGRPQRKRQVF